MFFRLCPMDLSSPTRDQTLIPCSGSTESKPLDHQGSFHASFLNIYLLAVLGLCYYTDFSLRQAGATLQLWFAGFSLRYILLLQSTGCRHMGSVVVVLRLQSIGSIVVAHLSMWDPPGPGIEPVSPALVGGFFTTEPPGNPCTFSYVTFLRKKKLDCVI